MTADSGSSSAGTRSPADELLARLSASPDAYPQKLDLVGDKVLLVQFDAGAYARASFLDDRILTPTTHGAWISVGQAVAAARLVANPRPLHFIFHTGHVGSTLVSRLLAETGVVLSLREPLPLRTLGDAHDVLGQPESLLSGAQFDVLLATFSYLWSRGYDLTRTVVVKATSSAGRLASPLLARAHNARAIYMNLEAEPYLATLLAGQNSPIDLRGHGPGRMRRLQSRIVAPLAPLHAMSIGELAAMSWLAESWSQADALERFADRVIALDFDRFLADVTESMSRILRHFELTVDGHYLSELSRSPVLTRYSKAPEHAYTPTIRAEVLRESRSYNADEIRKGLNWLERLARVDGGVANILNRPGG